MASRNNLRIGLAVAVMGVLCAVALISPSGAASSDPATKGWVRRNVGVYSAYRDGGTGVDIPGGAITDPATTIGSLQVPKGRFALFAKVIVQNVSGVQEFIDCSLNAGTKRDVSAVSLDATINQQTVPLNLVKKFKNPGTVQVRCSDFSGVSADTQYKFLRITAVEVAKIKNTAL